MFTELIDQVTASVQSIAEEPTLPSEANTVKQHAQEFFQQIAAQLKQDVQQIRLFSQDYSSKEGSLNTLLDTWKSGHNDGRQEMLKILEALSSTLKGVLATNQGSFQNLSNYRGIIMADSRAMASLEIDLKTQITSLEMQFNAKKEELESIANKLAAIVWFPIAWIIAEIANQAEKKKFMEQELIDMSNTLREKSQQYSGVLHAVNTIRQLENTLQILESSLGNLINAVSITDGQMQQVVGTLQHTEQTTPPVVVQAYLSTLNRQVGALRHYIEA